MKNINLYLLIFMFVAPVIGHSQDDATEKDRNFRFEVEPLSFGLKGFAGSAMYSVTEDNKLSFGLYGASVEVPVFLRANMFENVGGDTSSVRLGFQASVMARYKLEVFKNWESNPYVGFIGGWEYFDIEQPSTVGKVRLTTFLLTPYLGYEFYFFKKMLFINPQIRSVIYLGAKSNDVNRTEKMASFLFLPQFSLGLRL